MAWVFFAFLSASFAALRNLLAKHQFEDLSEYVIAWSSRFFSPFFALVKDKGTRLMLVVAVLWSILANFNKLGVANSSTIFWASATSTAVSLALFSIMLSQSPANLLKQISTNFGCLFLNDILQGLIVLCTLKAFELTLVANVVATKRISILLSVLLGHWFLGEQGLQQRLTGTAIMFVGVSLITLW